MAAGNRLRLIARVGIGLDNVDLAAALTRGIAVTYTPDAPSPAVAELTLGLMAHPISLRWSGRQRKESTSTLT